LGRIRSIRAEGKGKRLCAEEEKNQEPLRKYDPVFQDQNLNLDEFSEEKKKRGPRSVNMENGGGKSEKYFEGKRGRKRKTRKEN